MVDMIRCPNCRGMKKVAKLGGMMGDCNLCSGKGEIAETDKPKPVLVAPVEIDSVVIKAVSECVPASEIEHKASIETLPVSEPQIKIDGKKAIYRKKKA